MYRHTFSIFGTRTNVYVDERYFDEGTKAFTQTTRLDGGKEPLRPLEIPKPSGQGEQNGGLVSFYGAVREGSAAYPSLHDGAAAVAVVFAAEESARTGKVVPIPSFG